MSKIELYRIKSRLFSFGAILYLAVWLVRSMFGDKSIELLLVGMIWLIFVVLCEIVIVQEMIKKRDE